MNPFVAAILFFAIFIGVSGFILVAQKSGWFLDKPGLGKWLGNHYFGPLVERYGEGGGFWAVFGILAIIGVIFGLSL